MSAIASPITSQTSATGSTATSSGSSAATDPLASEQTFLKLLVAQIKNQDPTSPTDPTQFVGQLTQYSELEQLININKGITSLDSAVTPPAATSSTGPTPHAA
jgi:flagellar basal-body rod modification protein FlgD